MNKEQQQIVNHHDPGSPYYFAGVARRVMLVRRAHPELTHDQAVERVKIRAMNDVKDAITQLVEALQHEQSKEESESYPQG